MNVLGLGAHRQVAINYLHHAYDVINARLDLFAAGLGSLLQRLGHRALSIPASRMVDGERICAAFSHKLAAHKHGNQTIVHVWVGVWAASQLNKNIF